MTTRPTRALVLTLLLAAGCGERSSNAPGLTVTRQPPPTDEHNRQTYRVLARQLSDPWAPARQKPAPCRDTAQIAAAAQNALLDLDALVTDDVDLCLIRDEATGATREALAALRALERLPPPPNSGELFLTSFLCGFSGRFDLAAGATAQAQAQAEAIRAELRKLNGACQRATAAKLLLRRAAPKYSGSAALAGRVGVDVDEATLFLGQDDWISLRNTTGRALRNALVVRLTGADGEVKDNVHFVPEWAADQTLHAAYPAGIGVENMRIGRQTVVSIQSAEIRVFADEGRVAAFAYQYGGEEKRKDVHRDLDSIRDKVGIGWREGAIDGVVFQFTNRSPLTLASVTFRTSAGAFTHGPLRPGETAEVGWVQVGRNLRPGDTVEVLLSGHSFATAQY